MYKKKKGFGECDRSIKDSDGWQQARGPSRGREYATQRDVRNKAVDLVENKRSGKVKAVKLLKTNVRLSWAKGSQPWTQPWTTMNAEG